MDTVRFLFAPTPRIVFGPGRFAELPETVRRFGTQVLVVTGSESYKQQGRWDRLLSGFKELGVIEHHATISGEPSPEDIDEITARFSGVEFDVVVGIGGGSVIDAGKAVSAMLKSEGSVIDYLEDVGTRKPTGLKVPYIAVPTTAGTGSEATKNAVISRVGKGGFKKSLRHDHYVPDIALVDPELMLSVPRHVTAACGMDAFTQLLEAFVSTNASPITDALARSGLECTARSLIAVSGQGATDIGHRTNMAYAALTSGIVLANAGLGVVHGIAGVLGGMFDIPHGVACGTLLAESMRLTIEKLRITDRQSPVLVKFADIGAMLSGNSEGSVDSKCNRLIEILRRWTDELDIPQLSDYGISDGDIDRIVAASGNKNNPVALDQQEMAALLRTRL